MVSPGLDSIDATILKTLLVDARTSFAEIARKCGVSTNTIFNRFQNLKKNGFITGTRLLLETNANSFSMSIGIITHPEFEDEVIELLKSLSNIIVAYPQIGKYDIYATARTHSLEEIDRLREKLKTNKGIKEIVTSLWVGNFFFSLENLKIIPIEGSKNG